MTSMTELKQKQIEQAEELLFSGPEKAGFAKELFFGKFRGGDSAWGKVHESPRSMTVPLMILALLSIVGGWIGIPKVMSGWSTGKTITPRRK